MGVVNEDDIRIGDPERKAAAELLGDHLVSGRITPEEHSERLDAVLAARTNADLALPFRDLPAPAHTPARRAASAPARAETGVSAWDRLAAGSSGLALIVFFVCGFAFGGWAWAWIVFLVPGVFAAMAGAGKSR